MDRGSGPTHRDGSAGEGCRAGTGEPEPGGCQLKGEMLEFRFQRCIVHVDVVTQGDAEGVGVVEKTT